MTAPAPVAQDSAGAAGRYEDLRRSALGETTPMGARFGLTVFVRRGLAAWMRSVADSPPAPSPRPAAPPAVRDPPRAEVARLIAGMALGASIRSSP